MLFGKWSRWFKIELLALVLNVSGDRFNAFQAGYSDG
jgi:hypothetical protein